MRFLLLMLIIAHMLGAAEALAHGGGLDAYGCHHDRTRGGYHCHRGPLAGQSFGDRAEMLRMLKGQSAPEPTVAPEQSIAPEQTPAAESVRENTATERKKPNPTRKDGQ